MMLCDRAPDFEAEIRILTEADGGRKTPPLQGIRWDFRYVDDDPGDQIFMIHPQFLGEDGHPLPKKTVLSGTLNAHMFVVVDDMRAYHRDRLSIGATFYCVEGRHVCAKGVVTAIAFSAL